MKKLLIALSLLAAACGLRAAESSNVDYGQTTTSPSLTLVWQYETESAGGVTYAVITGLRDEEDAYPSGSVSVPTTVYDGSNGYVVKEIADGAFKNQIGITSISIPLTVQTIGTGVFTGCTVLSSITVASDNPWFSSSDGVVYDKDFLALVACPALTTSISIPSSVTDIGVEAFADCHRLATVTVPASVTNIGSRAFLNCTHLKSVTFKGNAPSADGTIFDGTADPVVYKQESSSGWDKSPWTGFIVEDAEHEQPGPVIITSSGNVTWSYRVFGENEAEIIGNGIDPAISTGTRQTYTWVATQNASYWSPDGTVNIPSELDGHPVSKIGCRAFAGCSAMLGVSIPAGVKLIDDSAFLDCSTIDSITLPDALEELGSAPFSGTMIAELNLPARLKNIDGNPFAGCEYIDTITVDAKNRRFVAENNFLYNRGKTVLYGVLPYYNDDFVKEITIPGTVLRLATNVFSTCEFLNKVTFNCNAPTLDDIELYADTAANLTNFTAAGTTGWDGSTSSTNMPASGFWPADADNPRRIVSLYTGGTNKTDSADTYTDGSGYVWHFRVVDGVAEIYNSGKCAVSSSSAITAITLPTVITTSSESYIVKGIGDSALSNLRGITSVTIPDTYEWIGQYAFSNCTSLASVKIGAAVTEIGRWPFFGTKITTLDIPASVTTIDGNPVAGASMVSSITVADGSTKFATYDGALYDRNLTVLIACPATKTALTTPETMTDIADDAFYGCGDISLGGQTVGAITWSYTVVDGKATVTNLSGTATTVTIPKTLGGFPVSQVTTEALNALSGVKAFASNSDYYTARNGVLYSADEKMLVRVPDKMTLPYTITTNKTTVAYTVTSVVRATGVSVSSNVTSSTSTPIVVNVPGDITASALFSGVTTIANYAFRGCNVFTNPTDVVSTTTTGIDSQISESGDEQIVTQKQYLESSSTSVAYATVLTLSKSVTIVGKFATTDSGVTLKNGKASPIIVDDPASDDSESDTSAVTSSSLISDPDPDALDTTVANVYNGIIVDADGLIIGTVKVTTGKASTKTGISKVTASIKMAGEIKNVTVRGNLDTDETEGSWTTSDNRVLMLAFARNSITGTFDGYEIEGVRNVLSATTKTAIAKAEKATANTILATIKKTYTMAFESEGGWNTFSVAVRAKGVTIISGRLANGTSIYLSSQLVIGDEVSCVPVVYSKKSISLAFSIYFNNDGSSVEVFGVDDAIIAPVSALATGQSIYLDSAVFDLFEGYTLWDDFLPIGLSVEPLSKTKWSVANGAKIGLVKLIGGTPTDTRNSTNPAALRFVFSSSAGRFTGSFKIYTLTSAGKLKTFTASIYGMVVDGIGYGTATVRGRGTFAVIIAE